LIRVSFSIRLPFWSQKAVVTPRLPGMSGLPWAGLFFA
jgi:hypothetical protein